jgi:hypothetical protein
MGRASSVVWAFSATICPSIPIIAVRGALVGGHDRIPVVTRGYRPTNGDGHLDLVTDEFPDKLAVLLGAAAGGFTPTYLPKGCGRFPWSRAT